MSQFDELPEGWVWSELKDVCLKIQDGTHFSPKVQYQEPGEGRYLYITAKNIRNNGIDLSEVTYIDQEVHEEIFKRCNPEKGDVLLVKDGVKTGDVAINTLEIDFSLLSSVSLLKPIREVLCPNYLRFFFRSPIGFQLITGQMNGSAIKRIVLDKIRKSYICLPPVNEQRRIVEKIEALTTRSRKARAALDAIPALLDQFRQSVLAAAFRGDLTADWRAQNPDVEPAEALLSSIYQKRYEKYKDSCITAKSLNQKKPKKPVYLDFSPEDSVTFPASVPNTWLQCPVGILCDCIVPGRDKPKSFTGTVPWITIPDIQDNEIFGSEDGLGLTAEEIKEVNARVIPLDSVVMSCVGRFGISAVVKNELVINQQLHAFLSSEIILPKYLMYHIRVLSEFMERLATSTTIAYLNKTNCNSLPINLPPLEEQENIIQRLEKYMKTIDDIENEYRDTCAFLNTLDQSILAKAFRGELVPQDPNDEPAAVLLDRIRAERERLGSDKKRGKAKA